MNLQQNEFLDIAKLHGWDSHFNPLTTSQTKLLKITISFMQKAI